MDTKKTVISTLIVIVMIMVAMAVIIAWLGTNWLGASGQQYEPENGYILVAKSPTPQPVEPYHTSPPPQDYALDNGGVLEGGDEYLPQYDYYGYPYNYPDAYEYVFTPIFTSEPLPEHIIQLITGVTFHESTPFGYDYLTYLTVTHVNFYGESVLGHLIVAADIGDEVLDIFREIYEGGFPIHSIQLIDYFDASDYLSMAANNSHAFNFRYIAGTTTISRHGFGIAIDINPIQNPYIRGDTIWPAAGVDYVDRTNVRPGMIIPGDVVYTAFISRGWTWGGYWTRPRDYHHFERRR